MREGAIDWRAEVRARLSRVERESIDATREAEIVEELGQHLEDQYAELLGRGMDPRAARERLLTQLDEPGLFASLAAAARPGPSARWLSLGTPSHRPGLRGLVASIGGDLRYGLRSLRRTPAFMAVTVLSLGIVIGANTAIFGLLDALLLRRLQVPHAEELVALRPAKDHYKADLSFDAYQRLARLPGLPAIQAYRILPASVSVGSTETNRTDLWVEFVTGGYFEMLGAKPLMGRTLSRSDVSTATQVAVVSEDFWRQHLDARADVIGTVLTVASAFASDDMRFTIVGVMPHRYHDLFFAHPFTIAVPITNTDGFGFDMQRADVALVARIPGGVRNMAMRDRISNAYRQCCADDPREPSSSLARHELRPVTSDAPTSAFGFWEDAGDPSPHVQVIDASRGITWSTDFRGEYRRVLIALMGGVGVLLLIACANVGTLLLSRAAVRRRDFAVRLSLGASRGRMLRQLLIETLLLMIAGTLLGIALAYLATSVLLHALPSNAGQLADVMAWRPSLAIFSFTILVMLGCTLLTGIWPARRAARVDVQSALSGAERVATGGAGARIERMLVRAQLALALVLASTAALFVATLRNLERGDGGYHTRNALLARLDLRYAHVGDSASAIERGVLTPISQLPGVAAAVLSYAVPVRNDMMAILSVEIPGYLPIRGEREPQFNAVSPGFFEATGIGMAAGRAFDAHDVATSEPVAIVSESFAKHYFANRNPIGRSMTLLTNRRPRARIVGVANDAKYGDLHDAPTEMWYMPLDQAPGHLRTLALTVRTELDPTALAFPVRRAIDQAIPGARINRLTSVGQMLDDVLARERFAAALGSLFGIIALGLAAIGVYGVVSYAVARRTAEIGVRMALGASPIDALWLVMRQTLAIAATGVAIGVPLALLANHAISSQLYGVDAGDPRALIGAVLLLALAAAIAGFVPGRRAARVDPVVALRAD
ncbi:MAG TPA: ADOP family duplicated permease [Gemmatimonadaceae bacterium]|nr:ADOP family duplicated permease [Gemmatimonadaceae bacterium]